MATKKWMVIPGGRIKRWKRSEPHSGCFWLDRVPPHSERNMLNRRERHLARVALFRGTADRFPHVHPREAGWYW